MKRIIGDPLLDFEFFTPRDIESLKTDITAMREGRITSIVQSDYWTLAMAELSRRQVVWQIKAARNLNFATWALVLVTLILTAITALAIWKN
jgi:hypothetical protein